MILFPRCLVPLVAMMPMLLAVSCSTVSRTVPSHDSIAVGKIVVGTFRTECFATDEKFVANVFALGGDGFRLALEHIRSLRKTAIRGSANQRELYLWVEALSAFYWPSLYNHGSIVGEQGEEIEKLFLDLLNDHNSAVVETAVGFLLLHHNLTSERVVRRTASLSVSNDSNIAELANAYSKTFFFVPEAVRVFPLDALEEMPDSDLGMYVRYWRFAIEGYAEPTRDTLRKMTEVMMRIPNGVTGGVRASEGVRVAP